MPHAELPKVAEWVMALKNAVGKLDKNTFFVGHSLGCVAVLRYIAVLAKNV